MAALPEERQLVNSDEDLAARVARGDDHAFEELYRRYAKPLAAVGAQILRDPVAGEDISQTSLLNALRSIRRGARPLAVRPWLYQIARNTAYTAHRARRLEIAEAEPDELPAGADESGFDRELWRSGLQALAPRQREVYLLRDVNGVSTPEVAAHVGLTTTQVEQALFAARNKLAEHLSFGGVACDALRASGGEVVEGEERALKAHLRACRGCRRAFGKARVGFLSNFGLGLRQLAQWLFDGGVAPVAAKISAVVATTALTTVAAPQAIRIADRALEAVAAAAAPNQAAGASTAPTSTPPTSTAGLTAVGFVDASSFMPSFPGITAIGAPDGATVEPLVHDLGGAPLAESTPGDGTPGDSTGVPSGDPTPADSTPADPTPADEAPSDSSPADAGSPSADPAPDASAAPPADAPADTPPADAPPADVPAPDALPPDPAPDDPEPSDTPPTP